MVWTAINSVVATIALILTFVLWYRTIVSEHPIIELIPKERGSDDGSLIFDLRIRNPGHYALLISKLVFKSPPRKEIGVTLNRAGILSPANDITLKKVIDIMMRDERSEEKDVAFMYLTIPANELLAIELTLVSLDRSLHAYLYWSKQAPTRFPWLPTKIKRSPAQLAEAYAAAPGRI